MRGGQALLLGQLLQHGSLLVLVRQLRLQLLSSGNPILPLSLSLSLSLFDVCF